MKRFTLVLLALVGLVSVALAGNSKYPEISQKELEAAVSSKSVTLLDVNGSDSYKEGHIPGAIDFEAKKNDLASVLPADKNALVVAYCGGPGCGAYKEGAEAAAKLGYTNVKHYKGGLKGWKESGAKLASK
ncbi:MAG: rhodanese-like domain-containing protein [Opitutaceae bacterium]|nr:rhodanese-like domain-containing protein [Opitutaceae bacterium]